MSFNCGDAILFMISTPPLLRGTLTEGLPSSDLREVLDIFDSTGHYSVHICNLPLHMSQNK